MLSARDVQKLRKRPDIMAQKDENIRNFVKGLDEVSRITGYDPLQIWALIQRIVKNKGIQGDEDWHMNRTISQAISQNRKNPYANLTFLVETFMIYRPYMKNL